MKYPKRKLRKLLCHFMSPIILTCALTLIYLTRSHATVTGSCELTKRARNRTMKYIFDLFEWQEIMHQELKRSETNETQWCDVPLELRFLVEAICRLYDMGRCARLPCRLIYSSPSTLEDVRCNRDLFRQNQPHYKCQRSSSLDLFLQKSQTYSYPSLIADPYVRFTEDLYDNVLHDRYRSCSSMWGFHFNYESIIYYPWTADRNKLALFDVTFGYDRSIHDFTPPSHLLTYIDQLKFTSKRLTVQGAMNSKKAIHSVTNSDVYWPNLLVVGKCSRKTRR